MNAVTALIVRDKSIITKEEDKGVQLSPGLWKCSFVSIRLRANDQHEHGRRPMGQIIRQRCFEIAKDTHQDSFRPERRNFLRKALRSRTYDESIILTKVGDKVIVRHSNVETTGHGVKEKKDVNLSLLNNNLEVLGGQKLTTAFISRLSLSSCQVGVLSSGSHSRTV